LHIGKNSVTELESDVHAIYGDNSILEFDRNVTKEIIL